MKKSLFILSTVSAIAVLVSCHKSPQATGTVYLDLPSSPYQYYSSTFNSSDTANNKATLGRVLFYEGKLSINNTISCGSCHKQNLGFADNVAFSAGYQNKLTGRNSKGIANITGMPASETIFQPFTITAANMPLFWDGRENVLSNLANRPITNHIEMGMDDPDAIPAKLAKVPYYAQLFMNAYGDNAITKDRISESIAVFMASIRTGNSKFEVGVNSNFANFTPQESQGFALFTGKYNCNNCHEISQGGYNISSATFADIGLDANYVDLGMGAIDLQSTDNGKFKVPVLLNVALTAPYMHDGRYKTLDDVIEHYSHTIQNSRNLNDVLKDGNGNAMQMNITADDKQALIAFLNTLTDYNMVNDPKYSNPFKIKY